VTSTVRLRDGELRPDAGGRSDVRECPDGPWLVRGADVVVDDQGRAHPTTRPVVAVCACDKSQRAPWCDGTHKLIPPSRPRRGA
jgi:hypothetical protein